MEYFLSLLRRWGVKIVASITDQGVFSGANFLLNILLVRWLTLNDYGIFAIAFSIFLLSSSLYHAFIFEPISIIGASYYKNSFKKYVGITVWIHWVFTMAISAVFVVAFFYLVAKESLFAYPILGLGIATPLVLFLYFFRQLCYLQERPHIALWGSFIYALFLFAGVSIIYKLNLLSVINVFFLMSLASFSTAVIFWRYIGVGIRDLCWSNFKKDMAKSVIVEHWNYGKWLMVSGFANWLTIYIYVPLIGLFIGVAQAGVFKAMQNLMIPLQKIQVALTSLFLPWFSKQRLIKGTTYLKKAVYKILLSNLSFSLVYIILIVLCKSFIVNRLYGKDYYLSFLWLIPYLGATVFIGGIAQAFNIGLKALKCSKAILWAQSLGTIFILTFGLYLMSLLKLYGAALSSILTMLIIAMMLAWLFFKNINN